MSASKVLGRCLPCWEALRGVTVAVKDPTDHPSQTRQWRGFRCRSRGNKEELFFSFNLIPNLKPDLGPFWALGLSLAQGRVLPRETRLGQEGPRLVLVYLKVLCPRNVLIPGLNGLVGQHLPLSRQWGGP